MEVSSFITAFRNINGATLAEKEKNFNFLLKNLPLDHDALLATLNPQTHLEKIFKLKLLLKLQRMPELVQILKDEEEYFSFKLLKNKWFCQKLAAMLDESSCDFVNGLLPFTSFLIRKRIISKLATYGTKLDSIYDEVCTRYGARIGSDLLVACSAAKVEKELGNNDVILSPNSEKLLYIKHSELFPLYMKQKRGVNVNQCAVNYVARHNLSDFLQILKEDCNPDAHLGKRLTRKILTNSKRTLIKNAKKFALLVHLKTLVRRLNDEELKKFIKNCCPDKITEFNRVPALKNLQKILQARYYTFLCDICKEKYKRPIFHFPDLIDEEMMAKMDPTQRRKWLAIKRQQGMTENDSIPYMKLSDSIPLLKNKIDVTSSVYARNDIIDLMLKSCKVNNDLEALAEVCEYVSFRHRNDSEEILGDFLYKLEHYFGYEKLDARHWNAVNSIINTLRRQNPHFYFSKNSKVKYVECLFRSNKLNEEEVKAYLKQAKNDMSLIYDVNILELKKVLILKFIDLIPTLAEKDDESQYMDLCLVQYILKWNKDQPSYQIPCFENRRLLTSFEKSILTAIELDEYIAQMQSINSILENLICTTEASDLRTKTISGYFRINFRYYNSNIDTWLLKHEPEIISANLEVFFEHLLHTSSNLINDVKKLLDPILQEKIINRCLELSKQTDTPRSVFRILAALGPVETFLECIANFYPKENKIGEDEENEQKGNTVIAVIKSFRYTSSTLALPALVSYCKGDYLRYALESLYYLFYHSPENTLTAFVTELSSKAVSVRKHSIFLTCIVGSTNDVRHLLKKFIQVEQNVSVKKHLFTASLRYFVRNPTEEFWEFVKVCMGKLNSKDSESLNMLVNLNVIPEKYKARHLICAWDVLKMNDEVDKNRRTLLSRVPNEIFKDFPLEFLKEVMSNYFLKNNDATINYFVAESLIYSNWKIELMDLVFQILEEVKRGQYETLEKEKTVRQSLSSFVDIFIARAEVPSLQHFSERWHILFTPSDSMREHLKLSFSLLYAQSGKDVEKFAIAVIEFVDHLITTHGIVIMDCLASELKETLTRLLLCYAEPNEDFFQFTTHLLKSDNLVYQLLVIKLLPRTSPFDENRKQLFLETIQMLRQVPQESIQTLINMYVMDMD